MNPVLRRILILLGLVLVGYWIVARATPVQHVEPGTTLALEVSGSYVEAPGAPVVERLLGSGRRPFAALLSELEKARRDSRISTVILRIGSLGVSWGKAHEIRQAIEALEAPGRRVIALIEVESFAANLEYFVASAAPEVYATPASHAPILGLAGEYLFLGGLLERFGIDIYVERIGRYKSAGETLSGRGMSDANREMMASILDSLDAQFVEGIAASRNLSATQVRDIIDAAPVDVDEMAAVGLIDGIRYLDELVDEVGEDAPLLDGHGYANVDPASVGFQPTKRFALVYGSGNVVLGRGQSSPSGGPVMASTTVSDALMAAADAPEISAVIFRIDSPGGSPLAADQIWRAVEYVKSKDKPVVASFSDVAASGGYYAAAGATAIISDPGTLTGSIGVLVMRPVLGGLFEELDIGVETMTRGRHADVMLSSRLPSEASLLRLREEVRSTYELFVTRVAEGRPLDFAGVDAVARGRVWTGAQAVERGLVDEIGGLRTAIARAKRELGWSEDVDVALVAFPQPKSLAIQLQDMLEGRVAQATRAVETPISRELRRLEPWLRAADGGGPSALMSFPIEIR